VSEAKGKGEEEKLTKYTLYRPAFEYSLACAPVHDRRAAKNGGMGF